MRPLLLIYGFSLIARAPIRVDFAKLIGAQRLLGGRYSDLGGICDHVHGRRLLNGNTIFREDVRMYVLAHMIKHLEGPLLRSALFFRLTEVFQD